MLTPIPNLGIDGKMKTINTSKGGLAIIDDEDFEFLSKWKWKLTKQGYAARNFEANGKWGTHWMHRIVIGAKEGQFVDHIDRNKLNNQKSNLRFASYRENMGNKTALKNNKLGVRGVHIHKQTGKFRAILGWDGKRISLGLFKTVEDASFAYASAAKEKWGEFFIQ